MVLRRWCLRGEQRLRSRTAAGPAFKEKTNKLFTRRLQSLSADLNPDEVDSWALERNTWQLVQALYAYVL